MELRRHEVRVPGNLDHLDEPHNTELGWQGRFRRGWPDPLLWRYALSATGGVDSLAITHLDAVSENWRYVAAYSGVRLRRCDPNDFDGREQLTHELLAATPDLRSLDVGAVSFGDWVEHVLDTPVAIASYGPASGDKTVTRR